MSKKKILVIGTGGTIASVDTGDGLRPAYKTEELISFFPEVRSIADVKGRMLFNIDSTNMQPHHWTEIAKEIERQYNDYDGFVITHGTDTMQYTSAALSFMLRNISKPVVLTGSVKPFGKGSDAKQNFIDSLIVASSGISEVCIVFHSKIIKGCKARKVTNESTKVTNENLDVYSSINYHLIGEVIGTLEDNSKRKIVFEKRYHNHNISGSTKLEVLPGVDDRGIFLVKIFPGFSPSIFDMLSGYRCILVEAYGPGNIPYLENSLIEKIEIFGKKGIPVFVTTQNTFGEVDMNLYEVGRKAMAFGAVPCNDMTSETALVKLMWLYGNFENDSNTIRKLMLKNFVGEIRADPYRHSE